jgi:hypothetical protein
MVDKFAVLLAFSVFGLGFLYPDGYFYHRDKELVELSPHCERKQSR